MQENNNLLRVICIFKVASISLNNRIKFQLLYLLLFICYLKLVTIYKYLFLNRF